MELTGINIKIVEEAKQRFPDIGSMSKTGQWRKNIRRRSFIEGAKFVLYLFKKHKDEGA